MISVDFRINKRILKAGFYLVLGCSCSLASFGQVVDPPFDGMAEQGFNPSQMNKPNDGRMGDRPQVEPMGEERYRIGSIRVDKTRRRISVPGVMLPFDDNKPIEFLASMKQGHKSYESVLSLDANAYEFNLACILIGLDAERSILPKFHFDAEPIIGDPVSIRVSWQEGAATYEYDVVELLKLGKEKPEKPSQWSYTGSAFIDGGRYLAQMDGVLIGLIHDPASIIEHREGLGIGNWGSLTVDARLAPASNQPLVLEIRHLE